MGLFSSKSNGVATPAVPRTDVPRVTPPAPVTMPPRPLGMAQMPAVMPVPSGPLSERAAYLQQHNQTKNYRRQLTQIHKPAPKLNT